MDILVLVKQTHEWEGIPSMLNPADKNALEAALQLKDAEGGTVTVLSMGPKAAEAVLREALSLGVDQAYLVNDAAFEGSDTLATAEVLAAAIQKLGAFDIIFAGAQSIDGFTGQIGPKVAALLGIGVLAYAKEWKLEGGKLTIVRENGPYTETWQGALPVLCTVVQGANSPRTPMLKNKMAAAKAEIPALTNEDLGLDPQKTGLEGSLSQVAATFPPQKAVVGTKLTDAKDLAQTLFEQKLIG